MFSLWAVNKNMCPSVFWIVEAIFTADVRNLAPSKWLDPRSKERWKCSRSEKVGRQKYPWKGNMLDYLVRLWDVSSFRWCLRCLRFWMSETVPMSNSYLKWGMSPTRPGVLMRFGTDRRFVSGRSDMTFYRIHGNCWSLGILQNLRPTQRDPMLRWSSLGARSMVQMLHHHHHQRPSICVMDFPTHPSMPLNFGLYRISVYTSIRSN